MSGDISDAPASARRVEAGTIADSRSCTRWERVSRISKLCEALACAARLAVPTPGRRKASAPATRTAHCLSEGACEIPSVAVGGGRVVRGGACAGCGGAAVSVHAAVERRDPARHGRAINPSRRRPLSRRVRHQPPRHRLGDGLRSRGLRLGLRDSARFRPPRDRGGGVAARRVGAARRRGRVHRRVARRVGRDVLPVHLRVQPRPARPVAALAGAPRGPVAPRAGAQT
jgi:hypothetical protein